MTNKNQQKPSRKTHPSIDAIHTVDYAKFAERILGDMQTGEVPDPLLSILSPEKKTLSIESIRSELEQSLKMARKVFEGKCRRFNDLSWLPEFGDVAEREDIDWQGFCEGYQRLLDLDLDPIIISYPTVFGLGELRDIVTQDNTQLKIAQYFGPYIAPIDFASLAMDPDNGKSWVCSAYPMKPLRKSIQIDDLSQVIEFPTYQEFFTAQLYKKHATGRFNPPGVASRTALASPSDQSLAVATIGTAFDTIERIEIVNVPYNDHPSSGSGYGYFWVGAHSPVRLMKIDSSEAQT